MDSGIEYTLAVLKPDAVRAGKASEIQQLIEMSGFLILAKKQLLLSTCLAEEFYAEHKGKAFFNGLVEFMTSGPIVAMVLSKANAIKDWRELMGPTNVFDARLKAPKSLRALYGSDGTRNATHGSDSADSAAREIKFFFPKLQLATAAQDAEAAQEYIATKLQPTLVKALTVLARQKPTSNKLEAISFLAHWMLENNPNKPQLQVPAELQHQLQQRQALAAAATAAAAAAAQVPCAADGRHGSAASATGEAASSPAPSGASADQSKEMQDAAATKVQAAFRGHQARKQVADMRVVA